MAFYVVLPIPITLLTPLILVMKSGCRGHTSMVASDAIPHPPQGSILHLLLSLSCRAETYLYDRRTWSICLEPAGVVAWNVILFSLLLLVSAAEMVLASVQILNGCLGCLCGFCEGK